MRRSYSAAGTFSLSLSRLDIEKPPDDIHRWRRTNLSLLVYDYWLLYKVQHRADYQADIENTGQEAPSAAECRFCPISGLCCPERREE